MALPVRPPYPTMEALLVAEIPSEKGWQYEPKWDGFRCLAFKEQSQIELQSKTEQSLGRTEWKPLKPKLVVEVQYDHFTGNRFRHGSKFLRWRPGKSPKACSMAQVKRKDRAVAPKILADASQEHRT